MCYDRENIAVFLLLHLLQGVPIRIELGPKDLEKNQLVAVTRFDGEKHTLQQDGAVDAICDMLEEVHDKMFSK